MPDNTIGERGPGLWTIITYKPLRAVGPIQGFLKIGRDFHTIIVEGLAKNGVKVERTVFNCSSLNVAYVVNEKFFKEDYSDGMSETKLSESNALELPAIKGVDNGSED
jgi:hypothetical protein